MIDAGPVAAALRRLYRIDDATLGRLLAGSPLTRVELRRALVTGALSPSDFVAALHHAEQQQAAPRVKVRSAGEYATPYAGCKQSVRAPRFGEGLVSAHMDGPPLTAPVDELLEWAGKDTARLHEVYMGELARDPRAHRPVLLTELRNRLGWPLPDTDPAEVLTYAGRPSWPLQRALATELARPERWRRPELIAALQARAAAAGPDATSVDPVARQRPGLR